MNRRHRVSLYPDAGSLELNIQRGKGIGAIARVPFYCNAELSGLCSRKKVLIAARLSSAKTGQTAASDYINQLDNNLIRCGLAPQKQAGSWGKRKPFYIKIDLC